MTELQTIIDNAWDNRDSLDRGDTTVGNAVREALDLLDSGKLRVATRGGNGEWQVNQWLKKAVLLSFRLHDNELMGDVAKGIKSFKKGMADDDAPVPQKHIEGQRAPDTTPMSTPTNEHDKL